MKRFAQVHKMIAFIIGIALLLASNAALLPCQIVLASKDKMAPPALTTQDFIPGEVVFVLKSSTESVLSLCHQYRLELNQQRELALTKRNLIRDYEIIHIAHTSLDLDEVIEQLKQDPRVDYAGKHTLIPIEPVRKKETIAPVVQEQATASDLRQQQWGLALMQVEGIPESNTLIAVIDTGISPFTPELSSSVVGGYDFFKHIADYSDEAHHGTTVAGTISGRYGVGRFKILAQKAYAGKNAQGQPMISVAAAADATYDAVDRGAKVINMSFGGRGETPDYLLKAIRYAANHGVLCVAAAGNDGTDIDLVPFSPSSCGEWNMIAVAAINNPFFVLPEALYGFSNWGRHTVAMAAPGDIFAEESTSTYWLNYYGTSFSSPFVSAEVALAFDIYGDAHTVKEAILSSVDPQERLIDKVESVGRGNFRKMLAHDFNPDPQISLAATFHGLKKSLLNLSVMVSNPSGGLLQFHWEFGDGKSDDSEVSQIEHKYKRPGEYPLTCKATYFNGHTFTLSSVVTITKK